MTGSLRFSRRGGRPPTGAVMASAAGTIASSASDFFAKRGGRPATGAGAGTAGDSGPPMPGSTCFVRRGGRPAGGLLTGSPPGVGALPEGLFGGVLSGVGESCGHSPPPSLQ